MIYNSWQWLRRRIVGMAVRHPGPASGIVFLFLLTVSDHVEFATGMALQISPFWHMIVMGAVVGTFGASLLYEVIRLHRLLAELQMVRAVVITLHHEINNPLQVIQFSAEKLRSGGNYDEVCVRNILDYGSRIRDAVVKLRELDEEVRLNQDPNFRGLIDLAQSR